MPIATKTIANTGESRTTRTIESVLSRINFGAG
jgi:hypothetical protein